MGDNKEERQPQFNWVRFGYCGTVVWGALLIAVLWGGGLPGLFSIQEGRTLQLNTFGDFLAGIFAPLAFLWLFIATMVQSQELALQRQELKLTRHEFELSREVAKQQAEEARSQAQFIGQQTAMLQAADVDRLIEVHRNAFVRKVQELRGVQIAVGDEGTARAVIQIAAGGAIDPLSASRVLQSAAGELRGLKARFPDRLVFGKSPPFVLILQTLNSIVGNINAASQPVQAAMVDDELAEASIAVQYLIEHIDRA